MTYDFFFYELLLVGIWASFIIAVGVTIEYAILVPLRQNPGAKRLMFLLLALDAILLATVLRFVLGDDYPFRQEIIGVLFVLVLPVSLAYLGWHIWKDQIEGAREYRRSHPHKVKRNTDA